MGAFTGEECDFSAISALSFGSALYGVALFMPCGYYAVPSLARLDLAKNSHFL